MNLPNQDTCEMSMTIESISPTAGISDEAGWNFARLGSVFQPIFGLASGSLFACEALVRGWSIHDDESEEGDLSPSTLFLHAKQLKRIPELDRLCWEAAASEGTPIAQCGTLLFLNVMQETLELGDEAVQGLKQILAKHDIPATSIVLDLVDPCDGRDGWDFAHLLEPWRMHGWALSLDSNGPPDIALAEQVRPAFVKVNAEPLDSKQGAEPLASMVSKLHSMGIEVIVKCVENDIQAGLCRQAGVDYLQGFLFASPTKDHLKAA